MGLQMLRSTGEWAIKKFSPYAVVCVLLYAPGWGARLNEGFDAEADSLAAVLIAERAGADSASAYRALDREAKARFLMASAMRKAVEAGREAFLAGRMPRRRYASASSPLDG